MSERDTSTLDWTALTEGEKQARRREVIALDWLATNGYQISSPAAELKERIPASNWPESLTYAGVIGALRERGFTAVTSDHGGHTIGLGIYDLDGSESVIYIVNPQDGIAEGISEKDGWSVTWFGADGQTIEEAELLTEHAAILVATSWAGVARQQAREALPAF